MIFESYTLTDSEQLEFRKLAKSLENSYESKPLDFVLNSEAWELEAERIISSSKSKLAKKISSLVKNADLIHIKNLSLPEEPIEIPYETGVLSPSNCLSTIARLFIFVQILGKHVISYSDENEANFLRAVMPRKGSENEISSQCFTHPTGWHMDCADRPFLTQQVVDGVSPSPDWLIFGIINGDDNNPMKVLHVEDVLTVFEDIQESQLKTNWGALNFRKYEVCRADSFSSSNTLKNAPIILKRVKGIISRYNEIRCRGVSDMTSQSLVDFKLAIESAERYQRRIKVTSGDIVAINNYSCIHHRERYIPKFDNTDRFFIRMYAVSNLIKGNSRIW